MRTYIVQAGDTLSLLAPKLLGPGSTWQDLWSYNTQISNPDLIYVGQEIYYPENQTIIAAASESSSPKGPGFGRISLNTLLIIAAVITVGSTFYFMPKNKRARKLATA